MNLPMISYFSSSNSEKNKIQKIIAEILMMGRSKKVHIITSTQRPDSSLFANVLETIILLNLV